MGPGFGFVGDVFLEADNELADSIIQKVNGAEYEGHSVKVEVTKKKDGGGGGRGPRNRGGRDRNRSGGGRRDGNRGGQSRDNRGGGKKRSRK